MECEEKYLESLQLLKQKKKQRTEYKTNKHVLKLAKGNVAENLLQLNFTPARENEEYKGERYELRGKEALKVGIRKHCLCSQHFKWFDSLYSTLGISRIEFHTSWRNCKKE